MEKIEKEVWKIKMVIYLIICTLFIHFTTSINVKTITKEKITYKFVEVNKKDFYEHVISNIKKLEGFKSSWYACSSGQKTIGYGSTLRNNPELSNFNFISEELADYYLRKDFNGYVKIAQEDGLTNNKAYAIASFIYNVGVNKYKSSNLRTLILNKKPIHNELKKWVYAGKKRLKGLVKRRNLELKLYYL